MISVKLAPNIDELWRERNHRGAMIDMTYTPTRLLPALKFDVDGLEPDVQYKMGLRIMSLTGSHRETFTTARTGREWGQLSVLFDKIWVTITAPHDRRNANVLRLKLYKSYIPALQIWKVHPDGTPDTRIFSVKFSYTEFHLVKNPVQQPNNYGGFYVPIPNVVPPAPPVGIPPVPLIALQQALPPHLRAYLMAAQAPPQLQQVALYQAPVHQPLPPFYEDDQMEH